MVWMCLAPVVHVQPCGRLRKLYSRVTAVVNHAYYENRDTSGHLRLDLVIHSYSFTLTAVPVDRDRRNVRPRKRLE